MYVYLWVNIRLVYVHMLLQQFICTEQNCVHTALQICPWF